MSPVEKRPTDFNIQFCYLAEIIIYKSSRYCQLDGFIREDNFNNAVIIARAHKESLGEFFGLDNEFQCFILFKPYLRWHLHNLPLGHFSSSVVLIGSLFFVVD